MNFVKSLAAIAALLVSATASAGGMDPVGRERSLDDLGRMQPDHAAVPLGPAPAPAHPAPIASPRGQRHQGLYLHFDIGGGYMHSGVDVRTSTVSGRLSVHGAALPMSGAVGAALNDNFVLAGEGWFSLGPSPTASVNGASASVDGTACLVGFGLRLAYYLMPSDVNVYLAVTPSVTWLRLSSGNTSANTNAGFGVRAALGKEWWVGPEWGVGLAGIFSWSTNPDQGTNAPTITTYSVGGGLSVSYN